MNIKNKINGVESAAIGLSFLGTVAAIVTQQVAYAATPLTLSLSLSLINKQKELVKVNSQLANLEQQLTTELKAISQQSQAAIDSVQALPPAPTASDLERLSEGISADREELKQLKTILVELERRDDNLSPFLKEIDFTKDSLKQLSLELSTFQQEFERDRDSTRVTLLEASPDPHSPIAEPNNIALLENLIGKLANSELTQDTQALITEIKQKIQSLEANSRVAEDSIQQIGWRFLELEQEFASRPELVEINRIDRAVVEMGKEVETIFQELSQTKTDHSLKLTELELDRQNVQESIEDTKQQIQLLANNTITAELVDRVNDLDTSLSDLHDYNLKLSNRINDYTQYEIAEIIHDAVIDRNISKLIQQEIGQSISEQFEIIKQVLPQSYSYTLVSGRVESRQIFLDALNQSQERLILVCPWLTKHAVNREVQSRIKAALDRGVSVEIGWGYLKDVNNDRSQLSKENLLKSSDWAYNAVPWLYDELQVQYPQLLKLKILGTHEKFLVCDRQFAMVGSHNYLTSDTKSSEREVGIKTDSPELIDKLIQLFDSSEA
ncbi:phospholipase D-like domain-containing protein [Chamaesiphon minutus]|uniref:PLD phosphodiesterase domain-containing protein n=1 Tax=Chamaesiphon minutus (strain ATCC 27169 / PCC 6605) TaxID=1173020 RepID=K9UQH6_CHAP6|nr:phospholipase D-like domain-containing protein [Chamaesiphon minutus]AFY96706.1 hypothetical protein Cha6605_5855 [Chamaesiphon minutus PCC 6605]